jgi:hypothetical protein
MSLSAPEVDQGDEPAEPGGPSYAETLGWLIAVAIGVGMFLVGWRAARRTPSPQRRILRGFGL